MEIYFKARTIAVVGASRNPRKDGNNIIRNLLVKKSIKIFPINPFADEILGLKAYPSILEINEDLDLVIIFIPPKKVLQVVKECIQKKVKAILIESSGFNEVGNYELFNEIKRLTQEAGIRVWGPNCTGYVDFYNMIFTPFAPVNTMIEDIDPEILKGNVSIVSQSGMMAGGMMFQIIRGILMGQYFKPNKILAIGNKLDINECDTLEYLGNDPHTKVIGFYLEGFSNGNKFLELCRKIIKKKPIVLLKGGFSASGSKAALSHTGSISSNNMIIRGALKQAGVILVSDFDEFLQTLSVLSILINDGNNKFPKGNRIAIMTISGGAGVILSDNIEKQKNLKMAKYSEKTKIKIAKKFPKWMKTGQGNPCDIWPAIEINGGPVILDVLSALQKDEFVDIIILTMVSIRHREWNVVSNKAFLEILKSFKKPIFLWIFGDYSQFDNIRKSFREIGIPVFTSIKSLANCLSKIIDYISYLKEHNDLRT
ncbi:MAG: CoA-binding protein [Candidatus Helarchaeota archaeon]